MKQLINLTRTVVGMVVVSLTVMLFVGCQTAETSSQDASGNPAARLGNVFRIGDPVTLSFTGMEPKWDDYTETIKEDGTFTIPHLGGTSATNSISAAGKTPAELQRQLQDIYHTYYPTLTVTVQPLQRYFYVNGEVTKPDRYPYLGETDIIKAITAAGGFTDFANRKKVQLKRFGAEKPVVVDCVKALENQKYNLSVYPGDTITVPRRNPFSF